MTRRSVPPLVGAGMATRRLVVRAKDVAFLKGIVEAHEGLAQVFAEGGGDLTLAAPAGREAELDALVTDLAAELGGILPSEEGEVPKVTDYDVAIVGGGPAGTSTALHLVREQGIRPDRVAILDKATFPRDKPCAGAVSQLGVDTLAAIDVRITVPAVSMRGVRVLREHATGETMCAMGIVIRRSELDASLLERARAGGVAIREGEALVGLERRGSDFRLTTTSGELTARFVAACDGSGSMTRRVLGLREPERKGHLYVFETEPRRGDDGATRGLIDFDLTVLADGVAGYYWDFPTVIDERPHVSRGIYHANLAPGVDVKAALTRALARRGIAIADVKPRPFSTRPFVEHTTLAHGGVVLVGEAAGIDRATGEGIGQAIVMGKLAARHLARALRIGGTSFDGYARDVRTSTIGRHMLESAFLARRVYGPAGEPARRLLTTSTFARDAAMRWYNGSSLSWATKARLGLGLVVNVLG